MGNLQRSFAPGAAARLGRRDSSRLPINHPLPQVFRHEDAAAGVAIVGKKSRTPALAMMEAAMLAADEPLPARKLAQVAGLPDANEARRMIRKLQSLMQEDGSSFQVEEIAGGFQLLTRPEFHPWLVRLRRTGNEMRLTPAMRETLAIIAYRQPIMRADIEGIRGVHCGEVLHQLLEKGLVRIAGRHQSLGRPVLYGTTKKFLQVFGLKSIKDLPEAESLRLPPAGEAKAKQEEPAPPESTS